MTLPKTRMTSYGPQYAAPCQDSGTLPKEVDAVIVGGGLNGVMTAYWLAKSGVRVALLEKGVIAGEASSRAFGWISDLLLDPVKMELCAQSKALWAELQEEVGELGYRRHGLVFLGKSDEEMDFYGAWLASVKGTPQSGSRLLTKNELIDRYPGFRGAAVGGLLSDSDGSAEPRLAAVAVARAACRLGASVHSFCAVRGLDLSGGSVSGVVTERGCIKAKAVLFAGNTWTRLFCGNLELSVPQLYVLTSMGRTGAVSGGPVGAGGSHEWAWRRQIDGCYSVGRLIGQRAPVTRDSIQLFSRFIPMIKAEGRNVSLSLDGDVWNDWRRPRRWRLDQQSPFERERMINPRIDKRVGEKAFRALCGAFPVFEGARMVEHWSGPITMTPDNMPIASPVDAIPGFYLLTGCSYGMTWSPALGRMMASIMTGRKPELNPAPFRYSRFFDGTRLRVTQ